MGNKNSVEFEANTMDKKMIKRCAKYSKKKNKEAKKQAREEQEAKKRRFEKDENKLEFFAWGRLTRNQKPPTRTLIQFHRTETGEEEVQIDMFALFPGQKKLKMLPIRKMSAERIKEICYCYNEEGELELEISWKDNDDEPNSWKMVKPSAKNRTEFDWMKNKLLSCTENDNGEKIVRFPILWQKLKKTHYKKPVPTAEEQEAMRKQQEHEERQRAARQKELQKELKLVEFQQKGLQIAQLAAKKRAAMRDEAKLGVNETRRLAANDSMDNVFTMLWILPLLVIFVFWFKRYIVTRKNNDDNDIVQDNANADENSLNNMV